MTSDTLASRVQRIRNGFQEARVLILGVELGLFERLSLSSASANVLAQDLGASVRGVEIVADALVAMGFLEKRNAAYANKEGVEALLVPGRPGSLAHIIGHSGEMFRSWAVLDETVRRGQLMANRDRSVLSDPVANRNFILGMAEVGRGRVGAVLDRLPLDGARRFVDLGGGPGHYLCEALRRHPQLRGLVVDLPQTVEVAREYIAEQGLSDRAEAVVSDFFHVPSLEIGGEADVVLVSQVLHAEGPEENRALLQKIFRILSPGGVVAVSENTVDATRTQPKVAAMFAVNMLAGTERGRTYTTEEIAGWLREAGFVPESAEDVAPRTTVIVARKPG